MNFNLERSVKSPSFTENPLKPLDQKEVEKARAKRYKCILMYKVKKGISPVYVNKIFENIDKGYSLRNADFHRPRFNTVQYGEQSLRCFGPYLWSKLNHEERDKPYLESFKKCIRGKNLENLAENSCNNCNVCNHRVI